MHSHEYSAVIAVHRKNNRFVSAPTTFSFRSLRFILKICFPPLLVPIARTNANL